MALFFIHKIHPRKEFSDSRYASSPEQALQLSLEQTEDLGYEIYKTGDIVVVADAAGAGATIGVFTIEPPTKPRLTYKAVA